MSAVKQQAIELIQALPDDCSFEDIQYHLYVRAKIQRGIDSIHTAPLTPHEDMKAKVQDWLSSSGRTPR